MHLALGGIHERLGGWRVSTTALFGYYEKGGTWVDILQVWPKQVLVSFRGQTTLLYIEDAANGSQMTLQEFCDRIGVDSASVRRNTGPITIPVDEHEGSAEPQSPSVAWRGPAKQVRLAARKIPKKARDLVMERDGRRCCICGSRKSLAIDHIFPWSKGGTNDTWNLRVLCYACNSKKRDAFSVDDWRNNVRLLKQEVRRGA